MEYVWDINFYIYQIYVGKSKVKYQNTNLAEKRYISWYFRLLDC